MTPHTWPPPLDNDWAKPYIDKCLIPVLEDLVEWLDLDEHRFEQVRHAIVRAFLIGVSSTREEYLASLLKFCDAQGVSLPMPSGDVHVTGLEWPP